MRIRTTFDALSSVALAGLLLCSWGCVGGDPATTGGPDAEWRGTVETEGDVTTVVNESGSVWGGKGLLVEEASIGVDLGADQYMLGNIQGVAVTEDRILVLDRAVPVVRVYDLEGNHLLDMGREGQGPGEFTDPYLLAASEDGRAFVRTHSGLVVFDPEGNHVMKLNERGGIILPMVAGDEGTLFMPVMSPGPSTVSHVPIAPDGTRGEPVHEPTLVDWEPWQLEARGSGGRTRYAPVPHSPETVWTLAPSGAVIQAASDEYRIEFRHPEGKDLVIERIVEPVPISQGERAWLESHVNAGMRSLQPGWEWNANPIPSRKPFFEEFYTDHEGVLWVRRILGTEEMEDCDRDPADAIAERRAPRPCFRDVEGYDVFGTDGRYLGQVPIPAANGAKSFTRVRDPAIRHHTVVQAVEDETGTVMVKRYRLVLPGE